MIGDAADHVRVAVQILGRRMHDDVEAELERPLHPGARERVVGDGNDVARAAKLRDRCEIGQLQQRIARRFDPDHFRLGPQRGGQLVDIRHVDERERMPRAALAHPLEQSERAAVQIVAGNDVRAGVEHSSTVAIAAMPEANACACAPLSRSATQRSSAQRVGLCERP